MPRFRDTMTGRVFDATGRRAEYFSRSKARFEQVHSGVPDGTVDEVLKWAGDDPDRRAQALDAERAGKGRKTLIESLEG